VPAVHATPAAGHCDGVAGDAARLLGRAPVSFAGAAARRRELWARLDRA